MNEKQSLVRNESKPSPIRFTELDLPVQVLDTETKTSRGIKHIYRTGFNDPTKKFILKHLEQYESLHWCDACKNEHKAFDVVQLFELETEKIFHLGLKCFYNQFGFTKKNLLGRATGFLSQIRRIRDKIGGILIEKTSEGLPILQIELEKFNQGDSPVIKVALEQIEKIKFDKYGLASGKYDDELTGIVDLFRFLCERRDNPKIYQARFRQLLNHPLVPEKQTSDASIALSRPLTYLFPATARRLTKLLKEISPKKVPNRFQVDPWDFQTEAAYLKALGEDIIKRADSGTLKPQMYPEIGAPLMNIVANNSPKTIILGLNTKRMKPERFLQPVDEKILKHQYPEVQIYLSETECEYIEKRNRDGENKTFTYQTLVLYFPMKWFQAYPLWNEFGRANLENFE